MHTASSDLETEDDEFAMTLPRPRSLNGLLLVGFGLVALPLLVAVIWALINLDRVAHESEQLVATGVRAAEYNRRINEQLNSLERAARQHEILQNSDSLLLMTQDLEAFADVLDTMASLLGEVDSNKLSIRLSDEARSIVASLTAPATEVAAEALDVERFGRLRQDVDQLTSLMTAHVDTQLSALRETARDAQRATAWQVAALVPGTVILILIFTMLVARPIRQIDAAIGQLGEGVFSKPIEIKGPTDLERLGRQLDWLRVRLLELAQEKNKFLRHMSHELKTPLANIREGTELLLDGSVGDLENSQREVTDILRMNGLKLQQLIENLLSFSAWQAKSEVLTLSDFELRKQVVSIARAQRLALKAATIQLKLDVEDIVVSADQDKIRTVLDNLLSNAVKFTPRGGTITIRARRLPTSFVIEFGDTGPGIPVEERHRIFEAFFQGRREQGGQVGGTGIGLSVVLECIQAHDGVAELLDSDEFPGAHFKIQIPQARIVAEKSSQRMARPTTTIRVQRLLLVILSGLVLAGCAQTADWIKGRSGTTSVGPDPSGDHSVEALIEELGKVASGDPAAQAEIYADAAAAAQLTPDVAAQLRFGLILAVPGHPESDPQRAQSILREVLAQTVLLTPAEISLATIQLNSVERQIVADSEARREQTSSARRAQSQELRLRQQLQALQSENEQLLQDLGEAEQKLEAITSIERSIRDQE